MLGIGDSAFGAGAGAEDGDAAERPEEKATRPVPSETKAGEPNQQPEQKASSPEISEALAEKEAGNAAYKKRDFSTALQHYEKAMALDAKNPVLLLNIAAVKLEMKEYQDAIETCQKCIEMCTELGGLLMRLCPFYYLIRLKANSSPSVKLTRVLPPLIKRWAIWGKPSNSMSDR